MKITQLTINYFTEPIGYDLSDPVLRYQVETEQDVPCAHAVEVALDPEFEAVIFEQRKSKLTDYAFYPTLTFAPRQRYFWRVTVWDQHDVCHQNTSWFETGKLTEPWQAQWLTPTIKGQEAVQFQQTFDVGQEITKARLYIVGLGLYEAYLNGKKISDEFFTPGYMNYHDWLQYQSYDITEYLDTAAFSLQVLVGKGWYQGNFGFHGGTENIYGDAFLLRAELHLELADGQKCVYGTDETWQVSATTIGKNSIYYGEDVDARKVAQPLQAVALHAGPQGQVTERYSVPVKIKQEVHVVAHQQQAAHWLVDFGQNMVGWVAFFNTLPKDCQIKLEFAETLVAGEFYRENLREARAAFTYVSAGDQTWVRPHFSFFGFRYMRVTGWPADVPFDPALFVGQVLYSDLALTGEFQTANAKVNRLYENILWSQKGNFLEVPMDCPQRDERMGWTGDAQIFSQTAMYNMAIYPFFRKYLHDLASEQPHFHGAPPMTVPHVPSDLKQSAEAVGVWGDAATIIPWNLYRYYGEPQILQQQYESMQAWLAYVGRKPKVRGLWDKQFQFGDWLALDGDDPDSPIGGTEAKYVANIFYWYSLAIMEQTATILDKKADAAQYQEQQLALKQALRNEYFTPNGRLALDTQTGYVLALAFDLVDAVEAEELVVNLKERLARDNYHLQTGFVGTPFLNLVLSKYGLSEIAYTLLLNEDYPSWLYAVNMGATTIWERWNSILPDGSMNPQGMNSLNHYAYGAIGQWFFEGVLGIQQTSASAGYEHVCLQPQLHWSLPSANGAIHTPKGKIAVAWEIVENGRACLTVDLPVNVRAELVLPNVRIATASEPLNFLEEPITLPAGTSTYYLYSAAYEQPEVSMQLTLATIQKEPLLLVRAKQIFAETRLFSSSNLRDHRQESLAYFVDQNIIQTEQVTAFLAQIEELVQGVAK